MNHPSTINYADSPRWPQFSIFAKFKAAKFKALKQNEPLSALVSFKSLLGRYPMPEAVLWDCLMALNLEPQMIEEQAYFTASHLKRLEQFIGRTELVWHCPHILSVRY